VHLDAGASTPSIVGDIHVGVTGTVHAAIVRPQAASRVFYTRSTDGGVTFSPELSVVAIAPAIDAVAPRIVTTSTNAVVLAFWDRSSGANDKVNVIRSVDDGASFALAATRTVPSVSLTPLMRLIAAPTVPNVLLAYVIAASYGPCCLRTPGLHSARTRLPGPTSTPSTSC
jgi:hypothetical protein